MTVKITDIDQKRNKAMDAWMDEAKRSVVRVGGGRGFIVRAHDNMRCERRFVVTAAHCLPHLPPAHPAREAEESVYPRLLGRLGKRATVWADCRFVDPIADIAVLGQPDDQVFTEEAEPYDELVGSAEPLAISDMKARDLYDLNSWDRVWALSLNGEWIEYQARHIGGSTLAVRAPFVGGMSGSPILDDQGCAIAAVSTEQMNPRLTQALPGWLLAGQKRRRMTPAEKQRRKEWLARQPHLGLGETTSEGPGPNEF